MGRRPPSPWRSSTIHSFKSIDEYVGAQPKDVGALLERVRRAIRKAVPECDEAISYNIPTYKLRGRTVLHFAGWKDFISIYPANAQLVAEFHNELAPYLAEKSTLRFPIAKPLPAKLIERIAKFRAAEIAASDRASVSTHK